jgi:hypothetical protein
MQALFATPLTSFSQTSAEDAATIAALREQVAALARRLEEVERRQEAQASVPSEGSVARSHDAAVHDELREAQAAAKQARAAAAEAKAAQRQAQAAPAVVPFIGPGPIEGLLPPEEMGSPLDGDGDDALRSDLPGIALRIPHAETEVRAYGFAKVTAWQDFNGRNQTDAPTVQTIPLNGSGADQQGGDFGMTARFGRIGLDTRTLTDWGTLETRIEGDFGGSAATSSNAVFRLRQAFGELVPCLDWTEQQPLERRRLRDFDRLHQSEPVLRSSGADPAYRASRTWTDRARFSVEAPETNYTSVTTNKYRTRIMTLVIFKVSVKAYSAKGVRIRNV